VNPEIFQALGRQGIQTVEIYSSSESAMIAITPPGQWREGYAGKVLPNVQLRTGGDGEIQVKTPGMMIGYLNDDKNSDEAFTKDGFYLTGDMGKICDNGYLQILGRKKDVFNTPEGSNIFPGRIEAMIEALPWVHEVVLIGDGRPFLTCLIVVRDSQGKTGPNHSYLAPSDWRELYQRAREDLDKVNQGLEKIEQIVRFALFSERFGDSLYSIVGGAKVRRDRPGIAKKYADTIASLYEVTKTRDLTFVESRELRLRPRS
jgi:long-chain acyl-CoA synthetase